MALFFSNFKNIAYSYCTSKNVSSRLGDPLVVKKTAIFFFSFIGMIVAVSRTLNELILTILNISKLVILGGKVQKSANKVFVGLKQIRA